MPRASREFVKQNRLGRLNRIAHILHGNPDGLTAQQIARRVDVDVRTVYRDLKIIEGELRFPLWENGGRYGLDHAELLPPLKLTLAEAVTLFLGTRLMARFQDRQNPAVVGAYRKLVTVLPEPVSRHVDATIVSLSHRAEDDDQARIFDILATAWAEGRKVRIRYPYVHSSGTTYVNDRVISPYFLEPSSTGHSHYMIGLDDYTNAVRTFKLERIQGATLTDEHFTIPEDFDATARFDRAWGIADEEPVVVRVLFHDPVAAARARETRWHPSQEEVVLEDGRLEMRFTAGGLLEMGHWILTWGDAVEVLDPPVLRERLGRIAANLAERYRT